MDFKQGCADAQAYFWFMWHNPAYNNNLHGRVEEAKNSAQGYGIDYQNGWAQTMKGFQFMYEQGMKNGSTKGRSTEASTQGTAKS